MRRHWPALGGAARSTVLMTAADLAQPWPLKYLIDNLVTGRSIPFTITSSDVRTLILIAGGDDRHRAARRARDVHGRPVAQARRREHRARAAPADVHAPAAPVARLPRPTPEGRPRHAPHGRRELGRHALLRAPRDDRAGDPDAGRDDRRQPPDRPADRRGDDRGRAGARGSSPSTTAARSASPRASSASARARSRRSRPRASRRCASSRRSAASATRPSACPSAARNAAYRASTRRTSRRSSRASSTCSARSRSPASSCSARSARRRA